MSSCTSRDRYLCDGNLYRLSRMRLRDGGQVANERIPVNLLIHFSLDGRQNYDEGVEDDTD